ncbi:MAG: ATP-binding cassette domain-containing protein [Lachnospiraceae bacterium]|nr:ATP-binding cassette domain-containing protein [Lachnospiraceae bacterium]
MTIELEQVGKRYGDRQVLRELTLDVSTDTCYAVTGEAGSGKTTLLRLLMGLEKPDTGRIRLLGDYKYTWLACGAVFERDALIEELSAVRNVSVIRKLTSDKAAREELVKLLPAERTEIPVCELGRAERRAVCIVRALSVPADLIVMDEPFAGMSDDERASAVRYIMDRKGSTPLVIAMRERCEEIRSFKNIALS